MYSTLLRDHAKLPRIAMAVQLTKNKDVNNEMHKLTMMYPGASRLHLLLVLCELKAHFPHLHSSHYMLRFSQFYSTLPFQAT